mmetsp:Transcript_9549/g.33836  ORF Transcript_9549/g.33836 Transcript_9549/m.33836 type:complete len:283 (-) Transcript_9549:144-992(-)
MPYVWQCWLLRLCLQFVFKIMIFAFGLLLFALRVFSPMGSNVRSLVQCLELPLHARLIRHIVRNHFSCLGLPLDFISSPLRCMVLPGKMIRHNVRDLFSFLGLPLDFISSPLRCMVLPGKLIRHNDRNLFSCWGLPLVFIIFNPLVRNISNHLRCMALPGRLIRLLALRDVDGYDGEHLECRQVNATGALLDVRRRLAALPHFCRRWQRMSMEHGWVSLLQRIAPWRKGGTPEHEVMSRIAAGAILVCPLSRTRLQDLNAREHQDPRLLFHEDLPNQPLKTL